MNIRKMRHVKPKPITIDNMFLADYLSVYFPNLRSPHKDVRIDMLDLNNGSDRLLKNVGCGEICTLDDHDIPESDRYCNASNCCEVCALETGVRRDQFIDKLKKDLKIH